MSKGLRLSYLRVEDIVSVSTLPPQPALVQGKGNKRPTRVVPIHKDYNQPEPCTGCVAIGCMLELAHGLDKTFKFIYDCVSLPDCDGAIYVLATPENKLRHIAWRLENDR